jgi:hypothetical protein
VEATQREAQARKIAVDAVKRAEQAQEAAAENETEIAVRSEPE